MATTLQIVRDAGEITINPDAAVSRELTQSAEATAWPVEDGAVLSDHTILRPLQWQVDLVFSPTPLDASAFPPPGPNRPAQALELLLAAQRARDTITLVTPDGATESLVITEVASPQTADDGYSRRISVGLQQVRRVSAQEAAIPASLLASRVKHSGSRQDKGNAQQGDPTALKVAATVLEFTLPGGATSPAAVTGVARLLGVSSTDSVSAVAGS